MSFNDTDELPIIRPKLGKKGHTDRVPTFSRAVLNKSQSNGLGKGKGKSNRGGHPSRGKGAAATRQPAQFDRRSIVKARVIKMNQYGKKATQLHAKYIERDGVEKDGSKGEFYGPDQNFNRDQFLREIEGEPHQFRLIISPEDAGELSLTDYTRSLMNQAQKDLGKSLEWGAVNHYNTDNPHTHIMIRGVDLDGVEMRIDREYISNGIRNRACEISTQWLGQRTAYDLDTQISQEIKQERYTSLDHRINQATDHHKFNMQESRKNRPFWLSEKQIESRLDTLSKMGLAKKESAFHWQMKNDWEKTLKEMGERGDIIKNMHRKIGGKTEHYRIYDKQINPEPIEGRLVDKGLSNELYDQQYIVIETAKGQAYYVNLEGRQSIQDYRHDNLVKVSSKQASWLKPSDENIQNIAHQSSGIYRPEMHVKSIKNDFVKINGMSLSKEEFVEAHIKRLHRLVKYQLAEKLVDNSWKIDRDLVAKLKLKDKEQPLRNLDIQKQSTQAIKQQEAYHGRTWLDRYTHDASQGSFASYGFGAEIKQSVRIRAAFLRDLGIDSNDASRGRKLDQLQMDKFIKQQEKTTKLTAVNLQSNTPVKGQLTVLPPLENNRQFSRIDDFSGQSFSLIPWHKSHEKLMGKSVTAGISKTGQNWLKPVDPQLSR